MLAVVAALSGLIGISAGQLMSNKLGTLATYAYLSDNRLDMTNLPHALGSVRQSSRESQLLRELAAEFGSIVVLLQCIVIKHFEQSI